MTTVLWSGGRVRSPADPRATALVTVGDRVAWVGSEDAAGAFAIEETVDLAGALVTPAFVDAHVHATATGLALDDVDLAGAPSLAAALDRVERHARDRRGGVVLGTGWDDSRWPERRPPTAAELDRATGGGIAYLARADRDGAVVSATLLAAVPAARDLPGLGPDGLATLDADHALRRAAYATVGAAQRAAAQRTTRRRAAERGIGCLHEMAGPDVFGEADLADLLRLAGEPGPDVIGHWAALGDVDTPRRLGLRAAGGDLCCDGSFGSRTAALSTPYADAPRLRGTVRFSPTEIAEHVVACVQAGLQAGFSVTGDAAVQTALAGFAAAGGRLGRHRVVAGRHRLEHAELLTAEQIAAIAGLGLVASVQPAFDAAWGGPDGRYAARLGPDRAAACNPLAALAAAGVPLALGSAAPVTPLDPWAGVRAAVHHRTPAHRLSARAAFTAATRGGWRAAGIDDAGDLVPGAAATFALWDAGDLRVQAPDQRVANWSTDPRAAVPGLPDLSPGAAPPTCLRTVVRGVTVFASANAGG